MNFRRIGFLALIGVASTLVVGCGGSGGSNVGSGGTGSPAAQLFAIDDMNTGFDHMWVTIDSVTLTSAGGGSTTIFDATATGGKVVDLRTLRDATGAKFLLLSGFDTPPGLYTGVNVTVGSNLTVFPAGAATGTAATFANSAGTTYVLSVAFPSPTAISASNRVIVDFDLANWVLTGSTVSAPNNAFLTLGSSTGIDDGHRHVPSDYDGVVSALAGVAPSQTFTLTNGKNSLNVVTTAATTVVNEGGSANPTLTNLERVDVTGAYDPTNSQLTATAITIRSSTDTSRPRAVHGLVTGSDSTAQAITITVEDCDRFEPDTTTITVSVSPSTVFFGPSGVTDTEAEFFAAITNGASHLVADGTLSGSTLTAAHIGLVGPTTPPTTFDTALKGAVSNPDSSAGTFDLSISDWEGGGRLDKAATVHVVTTSSTIFKAGTIIETQGGFFTSLGSMTMVQVRGSLDRTTHVLTAQRVATGDDGDFRF